MVSNYIHDIIKIKYTDLGYLPDYPYHLLSDSEMCDAFLPKAIPDDVELKDFNEFVDDISCYFYDNYYIHLTEDENAEDNDMLRIFGYYKTLTQNLKYWLDKCKANLNDSYTMPNWVYQYMNGTVLGEDRNVNDMHQFLVDIDDDNLDDEYNESIYQQCYNLSYKCLSRIKDLDHRSPSIFVDPTILRYVRLVNEDPTYQIV